MGAKQYGAVLYLLTVITLVILMFIGWVKNLIELFGMFGEPITTLFVARLVGVVFGPLGGILGWFA